MDSVSIGLNLEMVAIKTTKTNDEEEYEEEGDEKEEEGEYKEEGDDIASLALFHLYSRLWNGTSAYTI
eukprot:1031385-Pyramimonas_sp.AAC.1